MNHHHLGTKFRPVFMFAQGSILPTDWQPFFFFLDKVLLSLNEPELAEKERAVRKSRPSCLYFLSGETTGMLCPASVQTIH